MGSFTRLCVLCGLIGLLHLGRYLAEKMYYYHCASTIYSLFFTSGSSTCSALRSISINMTSNMAVFAGVILNSMLRSLAEVPTSEFSIKDGIDAVNGLMGRTSTTNRIQNTDEAPHM